MTKKSKIIVFSLAGVVGITSIIAPIALVSANRKNQTKITEQNNSENKTIKSYSIFPVLDSNDYYKFVRLNSNGPYLENNIVSAIVKDVLKNLGDYNYDIEFNYKFISPKELILNFKIEFSENTETKEYKIYIPENENINKLLIN
ncbi:MHO_1590 family protein [Mycoplasmopsis felifaucium]|uniref:MHO_1590 family protein n=1 Tax=Mycoplasmopsis felifaucium TaxID=35768 RepID=UPI00048196C6|nr:hypothetical protein [Mycoplasmopsis felifaucium]